MARKKLFPMKKYTLDEFQEKLDLPQRTPTFFKHHVYILPVTIFVVGIFALLIALVAFNSQTVGPSDSRIVNVYVDGKQQVVPTRAETVGAVIKTLPLDISKQDIVEPAQDTPITDTDFNINVYKARNVTIVDNGHRTVVTSAEQDPRTLVQKAGTTVYPEDKVTKAEVADPVAEGALGDKVVIDRATPLNLNIYGTPVVVRTHSTTLKDVLKEKNVQIAADDTVQPSLDTPVTANLQVFIVRVGHQVTSVEESIDPPVQYVDSPNLNKGTNQVQSAGAPGKKLVTYEIELQNGKEVSRKKIQEVTAVEPVTKVVLRGTKVEAALVLAGDKSGVLMAAGVSAAEAPYADFVIAHESGWRLGARNASGCLGLGQACPGSKLINACPNYGTDVTCQIQFFTRYAAKYGGWHGAYNFWQVNRWW